MSTTTNPPQSGSSPSFCYALTCEHEGCHATQGVADYVRYQSDLDADDEGELSAEEREDWSNEPIALCPAHAGSRKRHNGKDMP